MERVQARLAPAAQPSPSQHPGLIPVALKMLGHVGFAWAVFNPNFTSKTNIAVLVVSGSLKGINPISDEIKASAHDLSQSANLPSDMDKTAQRIRRLTLLFSVFYLGYGIYTATRAVTYSLDAKTLSDFAWYSMFFFQIVQETLLPALFDAQAVLMTPPNLQNKLVNPLDQKHIEQLLNEELAPSQIPDASLRAQEIPSGVKGLAIRVAIFAVQVLNFGIKVASVAIPLALYPKMAAIGLVVGYLALPVISRIILPRLEAKAARSIEGIKAGHFLWDSARLRVLDLQAPQKTKTSILKRSLLPLLDLEDVKRLEKPREAIKIGAKERFAVREAKKLRVVALRDLASYVSSSLKGNQLSPEWQPMTQSIYAAKTQMAFLAGIAQNVYIFKIFNDWFATIPGVFIPGFHAGRALSFYTSRAPDRA